MPDLNEGHLEFDQLTQLMAEVNEARGSAPQEHDAYYESALRAAYAQAHEFLAARPELAESYRTLGQLATEASSEVQGVITSVVRLRGYTQRGLISNEVIAQLQQSTSQLPGNLYEQHDFDAYETLFGGLLADKAGKQEHAGHTGTSAELAEDDYEEANGLEEINALDVLEHLERNGFGDGPAITFITEALGRTPISLDELRASVWDLVKLSKADFEAFKYGIGELRSKVTDLLTKVGVPSRWVVKSVQGKGGTYQLLIGSAAEQTTEPDPRAGLKILFGKNVGAPIKDRVDTPVRIGEPARAIGPTLAELNLSFSNVIANVRATIGGGEDRRNMIIRRLAEGCDISRLEARSVIAGLLADGHLFRNGNRENQYLLSLEQPDVATSKPERATQAKEPDAKRDTELLMPEERPLAAQVFKELTSVRYQSRGLTIPDLSSRLGLDLESTKQLCAKLVKQNVLISVQRHLHKGKKRAKRNRIASFILFPTQEAWNEYKADPDEYLNRVRVDTPE